jgi:transcriptional regulator with GAF, ATPase, and Fis domain
VKEEQLVTLEAREREYLLTVLRQTDWVIEGPRGAARILGLHPNTLRSRLKKLGIRRAPHDPS